MVFTPFEYSLPDWVLFALPASLFIGFFAAMVGVSLLSYGKSSGAVDFSGIVGIGGIVLILGSVVAMIILPSLSDDQHSWLEEEATKISAYYGIEVTVDDLIEMKYPFDAEQKLEYLGTATVETGESRGDFSTATLATEAGHVYLYAQEGAEYVELEPVSN